MSFHLLQDPTKRGRTSPTPGVAPSQGNRACQVGQVAPVEQQKPAARRARAISLIELRDAERRSRQQFLVGGRAWLLYTSELPTRGPGLISGVAVSLKNNN